MAVVGLETKFIADAWVLVGSNLQRRQQTSVGRLVSGRLTQKKFGGSLAESKPISDKQSTWKFSFHVPLRNAATRRNHVCQAALLSNSQGPIKSMPSSNQDSPHRHSWIAKFAGGFRGIAIGIAGQSSFVVHIFAASAVLIVGWVLGISRTEWCLLILCIALVMAAELFNSALEQLAKAITEENNPHIRNGLDIASGAVLVAAIGAAVIGVLVLGLQVLR